jgi:hypothetical protein
VSDLHGWITQQIDKVEAAARDATEVPWFAEHPAGSWGDDPEARLIGSGKILATFSNDYNGHLNADHIALHNPAAVLRRCAADRKILDIHAPAGGNWEPYACLGCGDDSEYGALVEHTNDCETLLALAEGYGLTEEQRAALDRPEPERPTPTGPSMLPDGLAEAMYGNLIATFVGTRPVEPSPKEKAIRILAPELKKIPGYLPISEEPTP